EAGLVQHRVEHVALGLGQRPRVRALRCWRGSRWWRALAVPAIPARPREPDRRARPLAADQRRQLVRGGLHQRRRFGSLAFGSVVAPSAARSSKRAESFPCTSITRSAVSRRLASLAFSARSRSSSRSRGSFAGRLEPVNLSV